MLAFIDFEASSLDDDSYPIEVGWVWEDGRGESHLIRPAPEWTDWSPVSEQVHRIPRDRLLAEGSPHGDVAERLIEALGDARLYASAPSWDGKWLSTLLRAAGAPRHALRVRDTDEALAEAAMAALGNAVPLAEVRGEVDAIIRQVKIDARKREVSHRAVEDAEGERQQWLAARELASARRAALLAARLES